MTSEVVIRNRRLKRIIYVYSKILFRNKGTLIHIVYELPMPDAILLNSSTLYVIRKEMWRYHKTVGCV